MKSDRSPNIMLTAIALTGALCLLAATQQPAFMTDAPRVMHITPKVDQRADDIANRRHYRHLLSWFMTLRRDAPNQPPFAYRRSPEVPNR
ncbi:MAG TPA: hypothetical protein ACFE0H_15010 [Elainellaceae cyanobacterium]